MGDVKTDGGRILQHRGHKDRNAHKGHRGEEGKTTAIGSVAFDGEREKVNGREGWKDRPSDGGRWA